VTEGRSLRDALGIYCCRKRRALGVSGTSKPIELNYGRFDGVLIRIDFDRNRSQKYALHGFTPT